MWKSIEKWCKIKKAATVVFFLNSFIHFYSLKKKRKGKWASSCDSDDHTSQRVSSKKAAATVKTEWSAMSLSYFCI